MTALVAGPELDAMVCEALGAEGRQTIYPWADRVKHEHPQEAFLSNTKHTRMADGLLSQYFGTVATATGEKRSGFWIPRRLSSDIAAAFSVVAEVQRRFPGWRFSLLGGDEQWGYTRHRNDPHEDVYRVDKSQRAVFGWRARFFGDQDPTKTTPMSWSDEHADTIPLAICLASLKALELSGSLPEEKR